MSGPTSTTVMTSGNVSTLSTRPRPTARSRTPTDSGTAASARVSGAPSASSSGTTMSASMFCVARTQNRTSE